MANRLPIQEFRYRPIALALAIPATGTAACLSILAGWQRGGWLPERLLWIAIGVVLVLGAHLLPALARPSNWPLRCAGALLWGACMAATCYGHVTFFVLAQMHAGEVRAARADLVTKSRIVNTSGERIDGVNTSARDGRSLTAIASDRAAIVGRLAHATATATRTTLTARLDALDVEASEARRQEAAEDRATAERDRVLGQQDALRADPVTGRVAALLGVPVARIDLLSGLMFAAVLEGVACFCWVLASASEARAVCVTGASIDRSNDAGNARSSEPVTPVPDDAPGHTDPDMD